MGLGRDLLGEFEADRRLTERLGAKWQRAERDQRGDKEQGASEEELHGMTAGVGFSRG